MDVQETVIDTTAQSSAATLPTQTLNQNVNVIANAVEFASAVIARLDSDLVSNTLYGQDKTTESIKDAVAERIKSKLQIKD